MVIGINAYQKWPSLPYAVNDARVVRDKLMALGFPGENIKKPVETRIYTLAPGRRDEKTGFTEYLRPNKDHRCFSLYPAIGSRKFFVNLSTTKANPVKAGDAKARVLVRPT